MNKNLKTTEQFIKVSDDRILEMYSVYGNIKRQQKCNLKKQHLT